MKNQVHVESWDKARSKTTKAQKAYIGEFTHQSQSIWRIGSNDLFAKWKKEKLDEDFRKGAWVEAVSVEAGTPSPLCNLSSSTQWADWAGWPWRSVTVWN